MPVALTIAGRKAVTDLSRLERTIKGITFPYPVMVGGGIVKTHEHVRKLARTDMLAEWGSIETEPSDGNGGRDYYPHYVNMGGRRYLLFALNSRGIPNPGMKYAERYAPDLIKLYEDQGKPLVINVSGKGPDDTVELVKRALMCGFRAITVNAACPNKGAQPILCYDRDSVDHVFDRIEAEVGETKVVMLWKISAGMPRAILTHNKQRVVQSKTFTGMTTCNTAPNGFYYLPDGQPAIFTEKNQITRGGMSGPAIRPLALDHTQFCAADMPPGKVVFGAGGIDSPDAAMEYFRAKAFMVQMTTAVWEADEDPRFVRDFIELLHDRMFPEFTNR